MPLNLPALYPNPADVLPPDQLAALGQIGQIGQMSQMGQPSSSPLDVPGTRPYDPTQMPAFDPENVASGQTSLKPIGQTGIAPMQIMPRAKAAAASSPLDDQIGQTSSDLGDLQQKDANPFGSPQNHPGIGGKILHALSTVGNIAGDVLSPQTMALIPGTQLNRQVRESGLTQRLQALTAASNADQESQQKQQLTQAQTDYEHQRPQIEQTKIDQRGQLASDKNRTMLAKAGLTLDADGNPVGDPASPAYQSRQIHDDVEQSRQQLTEAEEEVKRAAIDPNSPYYKLALERASTARQNAGAAITRAQAFYGNYLQHAFNRDINGNILPGSPEIENNEGTVTVVGSTNAPQAAKSQTAVAMFNDVHGALDDLESKARALVSSGGALNSPGINYALQHTHGTPSQFIQSLDKANLSPQERAYVISVQAAHENVQALRKSAGGTSTDQSVEKLDSLIPNATTPDLQYLLGQTNQIRATAERLGRGVTVVTGGQGVRGANANAPANKNTQPKTAPTRNYQGHTYAKGADGQWHLQP